MKIDDYILKNVSFMLVNAIQLSCEGYTIRSNENEKIIYTPEDLKPNKIGKHAVSFNSVMTKKEIEGSFIII